MRRWVFSLYPSPSPAPSFALLTRPVCPSRNFAGTPFSPPPPRLASRIPEPLSRGPTIRHGAATQTRAGTPTERRTGADLRRTQPLPASTTRPPVLPPPTSSAKPAHSNHPPARNLQPDYRPESCRLARSHSHRPDQTRAGTRTERWTSAAHSRFRPPRPVRQSSRLRLRRQPLHTATIRRPVTSCPITARKAVASPTATAQPRAEPSRNPDRTPDWSRTSAARSRFRSPRPVRRSSRLHPAAGLYYKRSFIARHPSQPDNDMRSALAALRSRTRALPPPSLPLAAEHEPFPPSPRSASRAASLAASRAQKNARTLPCGRRFHRKRENYFSFFSAFSIAAFRAARPAISPRVVFSTEALIFFTVDFVASAAARFSAFSAAISAFLASE